MSGVPVTDILGYLLLIAVLSVVGGAALAAAWQSPVRRRAFEQEMARFEVGKGRDPRRMAFGTHKSFVDNFKVFAVGGAAFGVVFLGLKVIAG